MKRWARMLMLLLCGCDHYQVSTSAYYERDQNRDKEGVKVEVKRQF